MRIASVVPLLALLAACENESPSSPTSETPCGPQRLEAVIAERADGQPLIDCSRENLDESADCIEAAQASGDGFRVTWYSAAEIVNHYVGVPAASGGYEVIKLSDWYDFMRGTLDEQVSCDSFTRKSPCQAEGQSIDVDHCFACVAAEAAVTLCDDREDP